MTGGHEAELSRALHDLRGEVSDLRRRVLKTQDEHAARVRRDLGSPVVSQEPAAADELQAASSRVQALEAELAEAQAESRAHAQRAAKLSAELDARQTLIRELMASNSWRLTGPVRALSRLAKAGRTQETSRSDEDAASAPPAKPQTSR